MHQEHQQDSQPVALLLGSYIDDVKNCMRFQVHLFLVRMLVEAGCFLWTCKETLKYGVTRHVGGPKNKHG